MFEPESPTSAPDGPLPPAPVDIEVVGRALPHATLRVMPVPMKLIVVPLRPSRALNWTDVCFTMKSSSMEPVSPLMLMFPPLPANPSVSPPGMVPRRGADGHPVDDHAKDRGDVQRGIAADWGSQRSCSPAVVLKTR